MPASPPSQKRLSFLRSIFIIRLINAFWVTTFFQPDEFFQALEPAWDLAFGPGSGAWLTWEWHYQLRSSIHPAIFAAAYRLADHVSRIAPVGAVLQASFVVAAPRALQAAFAALGDWYTWQLAVRIYPDSNVSSFAVCPNLSSPHRFLFLQLFSAWQWYCSIRTFSNSLEMVLTVMALYHLPWEELLGTAQPATKENPKPVGSILRNPWPLRASLSLAALAVVLRPTNVLIWATIFGLALTRFGLQGPSPLTPSIVVVLFREAILSASFVLGASLVSDRLYFGFWTFPPYNWLYFNISKSLAVFYGRNPWHYYLLQGLPLLCTTSLPFVLVAVYRQGVAAPSPTVPSPSSRNMLRAMLCAAGVTVLALSLISHKEVRFIYPLLPILNILAAPFAASFFTRATSSAPADQVPRLRHRRCLYLALGVNILLAGYLSSFHQPAPLSVIQHLRDKYTDLHPPTDPGREPGLFALFLMPCHSTPWRSHLVHSSLDAYALSCEPPLHTLPGTAERDSYRDEADRFYDDPVAFLSGELFAPGHPHALQLPRYIVGFEGIKPWLDDFIANTPEGMATGMTLRPVWSGFNGLFNEDWRRAGKMIVWDTGVYPDSTKPKLKVTNTEVYHK
ncbi:GPI mannosyltransferase 3 [Geosmithia morbida]|uniref:Mannosyltransferase n=1 Tax=Geosmithia morbida TaxID=1094350 RepID=A0A9P4YV97_9HYPO|nr:GPI mannosyltransferase 3 [Geosmithia morbida]KAF4123162.1 GPI mannosyltransferase 3 [Geosmithia morbida]